MLCAAPTGTATSTRAAPCPRAQRTAATIVAPVARPVVDQQHGLCRGARGADDARGGRGRGRSAFVFAWLDRVPQLGLVETVARSEEDAVPARRGGSERVLGLPRVADLADGERVERQGQPTRDLGCDRDATAGEADDDRVARLGILEHRCESTTGVDAIVEERAHTRIVSRLRVRLHRGNP